MTKIINVAKASFPIYWYTYRDYMFPWYDTSMPAICIIITFIEFVLEDSKWFITNSSYWSTKVINVAKASFPITWYTYRHYIFISYDTSMCAIWIIITFIEFVPEDSKWFITNSCYWSTKIINVAKASFPINWYTYRDYIFVSSDTSMAAISIIVTFIEFVPEVGNNLLQTAVIEEQKS